MNHGLECAPTIALNRMIAPIPSTTAPIQSQADQVRRHSQARRLVQAKKRAARAYTGIRIASCPRTSGATKVAAAAPITQGGRRVASAFAIRKKQSVAHG